MCFSTVPQHVNEVFNFSIHGQLFKAWELIPGGMKING